MTLREQLRSTVELSSTEWNDILSILQMLAADVPVAVTNPERALRLRDLIVKQLP